MIQREVTAMEARQKFGELLEQTYYCDDQIIIKRANKPMAALISIKAYEQFLRQRERDFSVLDRVWSKVPDMPADVVEEDIAAAIHEIRTSKKRAE